ncbi:MAG: hypothetical protein H0W86_01220 [Armatimonadetes bacterium]|nr:hypothetical protein [Armatimonadota bacterium]
MTTALLAALTLMSPPPIQDYTASLLKVGTVAPDFTLKTPAGKPIKFSGVYKKNRATILNFWFYH